MPSVICGELIHFRQENPNMNVGFLEVLWSCEEMGLTPRLLYRRTIRALVAVAGPGVVL